jgi:hypothetical protein
MWDEGGKRPMWFNMTTKGTTYEKPTCLEAGEIRHRKSREATEKAKEAKHKAQEMEISRLQADVAALKAKEAISGSSSSRQTSSDDPVAERTKKTTSKMPLKKKLLGPLQKSFFESAGSKAFKERERTKAAAVHLKRELMTPAQHDAEKHRKEVFGTPEYAEQAKLELAASLLKIHPTELQVEHGADEARQS